MFLQQFSDQIIRKKNSGPKWPDDDVSFPSAASLNTAAAPAFAAASLNAAAAAFVDSNYEPCGFSAALETSTKDL